MTSMTLDLPRRFPWPTLLSVCIHGAVVAGPCLSYAPHAAVVAGPDPPISFFTVGCPDLLLPPKPNTAPEPAVGAEQEPQR
ncbi:TonB system transport protein TonB, partial [Escherichia coli]